MLLSINFLTFSGVINNIRILSSQNKATADKETPRFGFVTFEEESAAVEVLKASKVQPIKLNGTHRLNVQEKKSKVVLK